MIKQGDVRPVMVTGDNAQCGYYIAKQCAIVEPATTILLSEVDKRTGEVSWKNMGLDAGHERAVSTAEAVQRCESGAEAQGGKGVTELAITGKAMRVLSDRNLLEPLLLKTRIFARVQPEQSWAGLLTGRVLFATWASARANCALQTLLMTLIGARTPPPWP